MPALNPEKHAVKTTLGGQGVVELLDVFGDEATIVDAARVSMDKSHYGDERDVRLIKFLLDERHSSPFEMVEFRWRVKAPLFVVRQWERHRTWRYAHLNEVSRRYTDEGLAFWSPAHSDLRGRGDNDRQVGDGPLSGRAAIRAATMLAAYSRVAHDQFLVMSHDGVCREQARAILPQSMLVSFVCQVDLWNLLHFLALRDDPHAQAETREYAKAMAGLARPHVPNVLEHFYETLEIGRAVRRLFARMRRKGWTATAVMRALDALKVDA